MNEENMRLNQELVAARQDAEHETARLKEQLDLEVTRTKSAEDSCVTVTEQLELLTNELTATKEEASGKTLVLEANLAALQT